MNSRSAEGRRKLPPVTLRRAADDSTSGSRNTGLRAQLRRAHRRYQSIFENAIGGIFQTTATGQYIDANPALARIYGYDSPAELMASLTNIARDLYVNPVRRDDFVRLLKESDTVESFESQVRRRDGRIIWISENARAVRDSKGAFLYYEGTVEDVTARKEAEEALERSRHEVQEHARISAALVRVGHEVISLLDTSLVVDRICRLTTDLVPCDCSYTFLRDGDSKDYRVVAVYGYGSEQLEAIRFVQLPSDTAEKLIDDFRTEDVIHFTPLSKPDCQASRLGMMFGITSGIHAALRRGDKIIGIHGAGYCGFREPFTESQMRIVAGIAQMTSLALENARLVEKMENASRLKSDFVATMSHELRTPLNVILGYGELLLDGAFGRLSAAQNEVVGRLDSHACQLLELINTTLDLGRLDAGRLPIELSEFRIHTLFAEIAAETRNLRHASKLTFQWQAQAELPVLCTDRLKLKVIIKNLVSNAVKFTSQGEVILSAEHRDDGFDIVVKDTGIGIAAETLPIIFEAFRQGDSSPTRQFDGVGLGLYIVRRLLELLGGTIQVESDLGKGSTFRLRLPARPPDQD